jgi:hypothetical protein
LNAFRRRHPKALNDLFTQVVELARRAGMGRLGHVAIDSTRVKANASPQRVDSQRNSRAERLGIRRRIRRWQQACNAEDPNEAPGLELAKQECARLEQELGHFPPRLEELKKSGLKRRSRTDPDSRFLKERKGFVLGYTVTLASSEDQLIVEQRVTQQTTDSAALLPMVEGVRTSPRTGQCGQRFLCPAALAGVGKAKGGCLSAGLELGARAEPGRSLAGSGQASGTSTDAAKVASPAGVSDLWATQGPDRTHLWGAERTAWDEAIPTTGPGESRRRAVPGDHRL